MLFGRSWHPGRYSPFRELPLEFLDFFFQLDHFQLAAYGQFLKALELGQPFQFSSALIGQFHLGPLERRNIPRGGKDTEDVIIHIPIDGGVIENMG